MPSRLTAAIGGGGALLENVNKKHTGLIVGRAAS